MIMFTRAWNLKAHSNLPRIVTAPVHRHLPWPVSINREVDLKVHSNLPRTMIAAAILVIYQPLPVGTNLVYVRMSNPDCLLCTMRESG